MRIGEILVAAKLVSASQADAAVKRQIAEGGRLGQNLVALGAIDPAVIEGFLKAAPPAPESIAETGISERDLLNLLLKTIYVSSVETISAFAEAIRLTTKVTADIVEIAVAGHLLFALGTGLKEGPFAVRYALTDEGRGRVAEAQAAASYAGPAPVTLASYTERLGREKVTNELVS
jgi:hypothetical protein